jgi:hypothetical protein
MTQLVVRARTYGSLLEMIYGKLVKKKKDGTRARKRTIYQSYENKGDYFEIL